MLERPATQHRVFRSPTVGDNNAGGIGAMTPRIRLQASVLVDNPSGSWVKLFGTGLDFEPFVAPYTLAWSVSLLPSVLEIGAAYVVGPTGQPMSTAGSPLVVYLFEEQVPSSGGTPFIDSQPEVTSPGSAGTFFLNPIGSTFLEYGLGIVATQRMRLVSCSVGYSLTSGFANAVLDAGVLVFFQERLGAAPPANFLGTVTLSPESPQQTFDFGGVTLPAGEHLYVGGASAWGIVPVLVTPIFLVV
jgi:hypothetical protein